VITTRDEEAFAMTTSEAIWALKAVLNADWMYANYAIGETDKPTMDDDELRQCAELFEQTVGEATANRLSDYIMDSRASADDMHRIASDATELLKLAAIIGLTQ
jgi:uncharacterized protein (DUF4213/DUF364 family)